MSGFASKQLRIAKKCFQKNGCQSFCFTACGIDSVRFRIETKASAEVHSSAIFDIYVGAYREEAAGNGPTIVKNRNAFSHSLISCAAGQAGIVDVIPA